jgi:hypothetical protein
MVKLTNDLCQDLMPTFEKYANYYANMWGTVDADEILCYMLEALVQHGERSTNTNGEPLLSQRPAYIAYRMAGWAGGRLRSVQRQRERTVALSEALLADEAIDVALAVDLAVDLQRFFAALEGADQEVLSLLAEGRSVRSLEKQGHSRRHMQRVKRALAEAVA